MQTREVVSIPEIHKSQNGTLSIWHEEESIVWLWAFPDLFPWPYRVKCLFTLVDGNKRWPGDLWGLDNEGNLLIIEAKNRRTQLKSDPFVDFEDLLMSHDSCVEEITSENLRQKWERLLKKELIFPNGYDQRPKGKTGGILPRSNQRKHIRIWEDIAKRIDERIRSDDYKFTVDRLLKKRKSRNNPVPHFIGLLVRDKKKGFGLNEKGLQTKQRLCNTVKKTNVHLYETYAERKGKKLVLCIKPGTRSSSPSPGCCGNSSSTSGGSWENFAARLSAH